MKRSFACRWTATAMLAALAALATLPAHPAPLPVVPDLQIRRLTTVSGTEPVRIVRDPTDGALYYLRRNGEIYRLTLNPGVDTSTSTLVYSATHHGLSATLGFTIGPDGTFYLVGNLDVVANISTRAVFKKGAPSGGGHTWSTMAETVPYARSRTAFDHYFTSLQVTADGLHLLASSGSRTDHGEIQTNSGTFPGLREEALTAVILRLPVSASALVLQNDRAWLLANDHLFCEGVRNNFDLAYGPAGRLFGTENGPDRDMSEELNWYREGHHYGFPWRIGGTDNPQQFPGYDPAADRLLDYRFIAVQSGYFHNDPTFPAVPGPLTEPILNLGPDADQYREPLKGAVLDASDRGEAIATLTAHRSPLGIVFDNAAAMGAPYTGDGFVLSWTGGDPWGNGVAGPFLDASGDLLHVVLEPLPDDSNYQARITRVVEGFANPIDSEIVGRRIYVLEYGSPRGIYEVTFPENSPRILVSPAVLPVP
ncbi:MAG TPA: PQQ-dependent sugar dehydrogenase, partial [Verrucomicrobiota bacterium]|nr:PQQ-dependent sugar dehydrogenase [Verrucomicrobiota bacterium]